MLARYEIRIAGRLDEKAAAAASLDLLERQIAAAMPHTITEKRDRQQVRYIGFRGGATEAKFLTRASWQAAAAGRIPARSTRSRRLMTALPNVRVQPQSCGVGALNRERSCEIPSSATAR